MMKERDDDFTQLDLIDTGAAKKKLPPSTLHARATDPDTSHEALAAFNVSDRRKQILILVGRLQHATSFECAAQMDVPVQNMSNQFKPLEEAGFIFRAGVQAAVPGEHGKRTLWSLTRMGYLYLREGG